MSGRGAMGLPGARFVWAAPGVRFVLTSPGVRFRALAMRIRAGLILASVAAPIAAASDLAQIPPGIVARIRYEPVLGERVPPELSFIDPGGERVSIGSLFGSRPILLVLARYRCDRLCPEILNGVVRALQPLPLIPGRDYEWVVVSLDPEENPFWAGRKKEEYLERYAHPGGAHGWHFLVGGQSEIERLAEAVGCRYYFDPRTRAWAEPMGAVALTPDGKVSSVLPGTAPDPERLAEALARAAAGEIGTEVAAGSARSETGRNGPDASRTGRDGSFDQTTLAGAEAACFPYSPTRSPRGQTLVRAVRLAAGINLALLLALVGGLLRRERRRAAKGIAR